MIVVAAAALLCVVVLAGLAASLVSTRTHGVALLAIVGGLLVLVGGAVAIGGVRGGLDDDGAPAEEERSAPSATRTAPAPSTTSVPAHGVDIGGREIAVHANASDEFAPFPSTVDRLPRRTVLRITATGFEPYAAGLIEQCSAAGCGNPFPVAFGGNGAARLQYLVEDGFATSPTARGSCRPDDPPCVVRVSSARRAGYFATVFGGAAPAPRAVTVDAPGGGLVDGAAVRVRVRGFTPGERVQAMLCAAPASHGTARCGAPATVAPFTIDADGRGQTSLVVTQGRVGTDGVACGRDTACGIVVVSAGAFVPGPVHPVRFAAGPTASYDTTRVLAGLLAAVLLLVLAAFFVHTTDWRKPTEADTPELDRAVL